MASAQVDPLPVVPTGRTLHTEGKAWHLREADGPLFKPGTL